MVPALLAARDAAVSTVTPGPDLSYRTCRATRAPYPTAISNAPGGYDVDGRGKGRLNANLNWRNGHPPPLSWPIGTSSPLAPPPPRQPPLRRKSLLGTLYVLP